PARKAAIKVLDFGIARHTEESLMLTRTGQIVGSASYMSPEQCSGKKPVDTRTDIYSLGVIMYEMLTGSLPYKGETFLETIYLKTTELPAP
ncbi:MAG TPA: protein kinase, partial [Candidatus Melainabacteria bacterium]|nr:protein kinase [Candidatus Melainabacteria bacterium]